MSPQNLPQTLWFVGFPNVCNLALWYRIIAHCYNLKCHFSCLGRSFYVYSTVRACLPWPLWLEHRNVPFGTWAGSAPFLPALQRAFCCQFYMVPIVSSLSLLSAHMKGGPVGCLRLAFYAPYKPSSVIPVRFVRNIQEFY